MPYNEPMPPSPSHTPAWFGGRWEYYPPYVNPYYLNPYTKEAQMQWRAEQARKRAAFRRKYPAKARAQRAAYARTVKQVRKRSGYKRKRK